MKKRKRKAKVKVTVQQVPPWERCSNPHCARLLECQLPENCETRPWPDDVQVAAGSIVQKLEKINAEARSRPAASGKGKSKGHPKEEDRPLRAREGADRGGKGDQGGAQPTKRRGRAIPGRSLETVEPKINPKSLEGLTERQKLFVKEYLVDLNATQASIRAGYSPASAHDIGSSNLRKSEICQAIDEALMEFGGITRTRMVGELAAIALSDIRKVVTWSEFEHVHEPGEVFFIDGREHVAREGGQTYVIRQRLNIVDPTQMDEATARSIAEVSQTDKGSIKVKLHDKVAAIDKLARSLGMFQELSNDQQSAANMVAVNVYTGRPERRAERPPAPEAVGGSGDSSD